MSIGIRTGESRKPRVVLTRTGSEGGRKPFATGIEWPSQRAKQDALKPELHSRAKRFSEAVARGATDDQLRAIAQDRARPADAALTVSRIMRECIGPTLRDLDYRTRRYGRDGREVSVIGVYSDVGWTSEAVSMRGYADDIEDALNPDTLWADLMPADFNRVWSRGATRGVAESRVQCLTMAAGWAAENYRLPLLARPSGVAKKARKLKSTKTLVVLSPKEYGLVLGALNDWEKHGLDIRIVRLLALSLEARPGQLLDMRGSDVVRVGGMPLLFPRTSRIKLGYPLLSTNLAHFDWLEGCQGRTPLFPSEKDPGKPMRRERALELFKQVLEAAGVRTDCGWVSARKAATNLAPKVLSWARKKGLLVMDDDAVLDMLTWHAPSGTRNKAYRTLLTAVTPQHVPDVGDDAYMLLRSIEALRGYVRESAMKSARIRGHTGTKRGPQNDETPAK